MKIMHILTDSGIGGAGILLENQLLASRLPRRTFSVVLPRGAALAPRLSSRGFSVFPILRGADRSVSPADLFRLSALIRRVRPDILHTHASLTGRLAAWLCGVPIRLATRHCAYPAGRGGRPLARRLHAWGDRHLSTGTVATAYAAADNLRALGIPPEKILFIRNGARPVERMPQNLRTATRLSCGIPPHAFVLGMCARLAPVKGQALLLTAAKELPFAGWHILLVGGGEEEERLRHLCRTLGLSDRVTFTGHTEEPGRYMNLFDLAINCSGGTETSCLALSEAMSLGIPIVASRYGGNTELVREGENGLLFPVGDAAALAACITRLHDDAELFYRLSRGGEERFCRDLHAEGMARAYDRLYLSLYDAPRKKGELRAPPPAVWQKYAPLPAQGSQL